MGELHQWIAAQGGDQSCADVWDRNLDDFLVAAGAGEFRQRARANSAPPSQSSDRVRRTCLRLLAATSGRRLRLGPAAGTSSPATPKAEARLLLLALGRQQTRVGVRTAAVAHLAANGLRVWEISQLRCAQIDGTWLRQVTRRDPGPGPDHVEDVALTSPARDALERWLSVRARVVRSDRVETVFVSLGGAATLEGPHAAGYPVTTRTLDRSHRDAVRDHLAVRNPRAVAPIAVAELSLTRLAEMVRR